MTGKPLAIEILGSDVWVAHSDAVIRRINLEVSPFASLSELKLMLLSPALSLKCTEDMRAQSLHWH